MHHMCFAIGVMLVAVTVSVKGVTISSFNEEIPVDEELAIAVQKSMEGSWFRRVRVIQEATIPG